MHKYIVSIMVRKSKLIVIATMFSVVSTKVVATDSFNDFMIKLIVAQVSELELKPENHEIIVELTESFTRHSPDYSQFSGTDIIQSCALINAGMKFSEEFGDEKLSLDLTSIRESMKNTVQEHKYAYLLFQECRSTYNLKDVESQKRRPQ